MHTELISISMLKLLKLKMEILIAVEYDMFGITAWIFKTRLLWLSNGIKKAKSAYSSTAHCLCDQ